VDHAGEQTTAAADGICCRFCMSIRWPPGAQVPALGLQLLVFLPKNR
jgi:hypothetical protein